MTLAYVTNMVLTSSVLLFVIYSCLATLILCLAYLIEQEVQKVREQKREEREMLERSQRPAHAAAEQMYAS